MELVVTLLAVGALLVLAETVLPGMVAGICGVGCLAAGVVAGYMQFGGRTGSLILLGVVVAVIAGFGIWLKYFPGSHLAQFFVSRQISGDFGVERPQLLNQTGKALTQLRPAGTAIINGQRIDVVTEGALIERGQAVKVVNVDGMRVVVRQTESEQT